MISITVRSKFDIKKEFVRFTLRRDRDGFVIDSIDSPLNSVSRGYGEKISAGFNYSFADEYGFHEVFGIPNDKIRNSLILMAREEILNKRIVEFNFHNYEDINKLIANDQLINGLQHNPACTITQIEHILSDDDKLYEFSIWISYFIYKLNLQGMQLDISQIADSILRSRKINMLIWSIDRLLMFDYTKKGSYSEVRKLVSAGGSEFDTRHLKFFSIENAMNYSHWRTSGSISIAARKIKAIDSLSPNDAEMLLQLFQSQSQKTSLFMPKIGTPRATAINILKNYYCNNEAFNLNILCDDLGINLHLIDLDSELLGLFINNPEAHQSAIFINKSRRTSRSHNYTIAHEIGHYLLHFDDFVIDCSEGDIYFPDQRDSREVEANEFASELLMPSSRMREFFSERFSSDNVLGMSSRFNVSIEAVARRRISLDGRRRLAFIVVRGQEVASIFASTVTDDGMRWIGKRTIGKGAVQVDVAEQLVTHGERNLAEYLTDADSGNEILDDLDIDIYPFLSGDGYYLLVESHRR